MKIGTLADWFGMGLIEGIRESERCGAEGVQVYAAGELDPRTVSPEMISEVKKTAEECHQEIVALCGELGGHGLSIEADNPDKIAYIKAVIDMGLALDCHIVTTHIGIVPEDTSDPTYGVLKRACQELGSYAAERGSAIAIETGPEFIRTLKTFVDDCGKGVCINYDPGNIVMVTNDDEVAAVYTAGKSIVHTHAKDGRAKKYIGAANYYRGFAEGGLEWASRVDFVKEVPLGEGQVRWHEYLTALKDIGYDGFLTIEHEVKDGAEEIRTAVEFLREQLEQL